MWLVIWIITAIALTGTYLNATGDKRGFVLWMVSNTGLSLWNLSIGEYAQATLFLCYLILAVYGYITWLRKEDQKMDS